MVKTVFDVSGSSQRNKRRNKKGNKMFKAPLEAQGYEEKCLNERTHSPTCGHQAFRMAFVSASIVLGTKLT